MRYLIALVALIVALGSLGVHLALSTHLTVLGICWLPIWWADIRLRPLTPCKHCEGGKSWDARRQHFGEHCAGGPLRLGSCHAAGKKLRWEIKLLRIFGAARDLPDPVAEARSE